MQRHRFAPHAAGVYEPFFFRHGKFKENGVLCVNVLSGQHQNLSAIFANSQLRSEERFLHDQWLDAGNRLTGCWATAVANVDCTISTSHEVGSHSVFYCEVRQIRHHQAGDGWCGSTASSIPLARSRTAKVHPNEKYPIA